MKNLVVSRGKSRLCQSSPLNLLSKRIGHCLVSAIMMIVPVIITSCNSNDGDPNSTYRDYGSFRIGKMNLTGAAQLALIKGTGSRAIEGEYLSAGLYKIDSNGRIAAVGVYFTTDTLGNKLTTEYQLRVVPEAVHHLTDNYAVAVNCDYYDGDGDIVCDKWMSMGVDEEVKLIRQDVPYKNLLIRLSDGKLWCMDNIKIDLNFEAKDWWQESPRGELYYCYGNPYKFNLNSDTPSFEQISSSTILNQDNYRILDNNVLVSIWDRDGMEGCNELRLIWPRSGFQILSVDDFSDIYDQFTKHYIYSKDYPELIDLGVGDFYYYTNRCEVRFFNLKTGGIGVVIATSARVLDTYGRSIDINKVLKFLPEDWGRYYNIKIGDTSGTATTNGAPIISGPITLPGYKNWVGHETIESIYSGDGFILIASRGDSGYYLSRIDLMNNKWEFLKTVNYPIHFENEYANKIWSYEVSDSGVHYFDVNTFDTGFIPFKMNIPAYMQANYSINPKGYIEFEAQNPATGNYNRIVIDLLTGEGEQSVIEANYYFATLISLN